MSISFSPLNGQISFTNIQTQFNGGKNPISLSEYLIGASGSYVNGTNIPSMNIKYIASTATISATQISVLNFYNKRNLQYDLYEYIVPGNKLGDMSETGGTTIINSAGFGSNPTNASIGTVGFSFFWFGYDAGINNNIQWNTNNAITFGGGNLGNNLDWSLATTAKSFLIGTDPPLRRWTQMSKGFTSYILYGHNIKRFIVKAADSSSASTSRYELDINLIRGPFYQYIELKIVKWLTSYPNIVGRWNISDGVKFYNTFPLNILGPPVGANNSLVLRGSLEGTDWVVYTNYYMNIPYATITSATDAIKSMGANLILRLDGYNIDGLNNSTLTEGTAISSWYNSGNQAGLTTTQTNAAKRPTYNIKGGVQFSSGKVLLSTVDLSSYPTMNIFFVWKTKSSPAIALLQYNWNQSINYRRFMYNSVSSSGVLSEIGNVITSGTAANGLLYDFPYDTTVVINCEYNWVLDNLSTSLYINNNYKLTNIYTTSVNSGAQSVTQTYFGAANNNGTNSINGIIYEIIIINKLLSETERTNIYKLLETRWGPTLYNDTITSMGSNLVYRISGDNVDSSYNYTFFDNLRLATTIEYPIKYWYNSGNNRTETAISVYGTQQQYSEMRPIFIGNGVLFSNGTYMNSPAQYIQNPIINIFVVWKKTAASTTNRYLWSQFNGDNKYNRTFYIGGDTSVNVGYGNDSLLTITYTFPLYATTVVNCEYNSTGLIGKIYINNYLLGTFNNTDYLSYSPANITYGSSGYTLPPPPDSSINGIIYEIIIINRLLSDTERDNIYNFLNVKWGPFYTDAITSMKDKLVLRLDGYNIDGKKNTTLTSGTSTISWWFNSGNAASLSTVMQYVDLTLYPTYNKNGVEFLNNSTTVLITNVNFNNYPIMNIFLVFKKTVNVPAGGENYLWASTDTTSLKSVWLSDNYLNIATGGTGGTTVTVEYTFPIGETFIVNCEYNTNSSKMYIDNILKKTFSVTNSSSDYMLSCFGNKSISAPIASTIKGIFYEIIIINRVLLDTERKNIYNCLNNKWDTYFDPMGTSLILRHDGKNIDGTNNSTLTSGTSTISSWFNSGNVTSLTTTQTDVAKRPTYTNNSAVFNTVRGLVSTIALYDYQIMNLFIVWSLTTMPNSTSTYMLFSDDKICRGMWITSSPSSRITIVRGQSGSESTAHFVFNTFVLDTTVIYNLEYNLVGNPGNFYINNILKASFTTLIADSLDNLGAAKTHFGFHANYGYNLNGKIYEIIIINRLLKTNERTNVYNLLKTKWNVP